MNNVQSFSLGRRWLSNFHKEIGKTDVGYKQKSKITATVSDLQKHNFLFYPHPPLRGTFPQGKALGTRK